MRIGTLAQRVGVAPDTLRAWERRYGVPTPARTEGGYRLYSAGDEARIRLMLDHMRAGLAPAQAAEMARADFRPLPEPAVAATPGAVEVREQLLSACLAFDAVAAHRCIDSALQHLSLRDAMVDVLLWTLRAVGDRWAAGTGTIAEEHFTSAVVRERLLALGRHWDAGSGPRAMLACPAGERHDTALVAAGVWLNHLGWRITFLGPDLPASTIAEAVVSVSPDIVVLSLTTPQRDQFVVPPLGVPTFLVGPAAAGVQAEGASVLGGGPLDVGSAIDRHWRSGDDSGMTNP